MTNRPVPLWFAVGNLLVGYFMLLASGTILTTAGIPGRVGPRIGAIACFAAALLPVGLIWQCIRDARPLNELVEAEQRAGAR